MIGLTCCVNYSDMLALTWPFNRPFFDDLVVVTAPDDHKTAGVCREHGRNGLRLWGSMWAGMTWIFTG
jgi:hypothetical protein